MHWQSWQGSQQASWSSGAPGGQTNSPAVVLQEGQEGPGSGIDAAADGLGCTAAAAGCTAPAVANPPDAWPEPLPRPCKPYFTDKDSTYEVVEHWHS